MLALLASLGACADIVFKPLETKKSQESSEAISVSFPTRLPVDQPSVGCDPAEDVTLTVSADDSNSMLSPVFLRELVRQHTGDSAHIASVPARTWEFFNYYDFGYPPADPGTLRVDVDMRAVPDAVGEFTVQIGVSGEAWPPPARSPINLTLVLDESGSMRGHPLEMLKASCRAIAASLRAGDVISMVTWDTTNAVRLASHSVEGPNDPLLLARVDELVASGGTDLHGGLVAGYALAHHARESERINRIVLITDGQANVGITNESLIAAHAEDSDSEGIYMVGVAVGDVAGARFNESLIDTVTDAGKGASLYIPSADEAEKVFGTRFASTFGVAARNVQIRLELPPGFEILEFSGEEYSEDPDEIRPQHLAPNDSMVLFQKIGTCAPHLISGGSPITVAATWEDPSTGEQREVTVEHTFGELLGQASASMAKGSAVFAYARIFRHLDDEEALDENLANAFDALSLAESLLPDDAELAEIRSVLELL